MIIKHLNLHLEEVPVLYKRREYSGIEINKPLGT